METIQELEVWYIIPSIRKELSLALKNKGLKQVEIAERLGITKAAVNQYISKKRGNEIKLNNKIIEEIKLSAEKIKNKIDAIREIQNLINIARKERIVCEIHKKINKDFNECNVCFEPELIKVGL